MLEAHGVVLEGREQVRLGQVAGVAGLGEQAQVGQLQFLDHLCFRLQRLLVAFGTDQRVAPEQEPEYPDAENGETYVEG